MKYCPVRLSEHKNHPNPRKEKGAVAILVALSMVVLVGMVGLTLDLGKLYAAKSELQNSADACALAAARELSGSNSNQLTLAETAGIRAGTANNVLFQGAPVALNVNDSVQFSLALDGSYSTKSGLSATEALTMKYARCRVERTGIANWLIPILNILPGNSIAATQDVRAVAVATLAPSQVFSCPIPVGICEGAITTAVPGSWIKSVVGGGGGLTGSFGWVDFSPPAGGASELGSNLTSVCGVTDLPAVGTNVVEQGAIASLANDWNSRFGLYFGSLNKPATPSGNATPDYTGFAYYPLLNGVPASPAPGQVINKYSSGVDSYKIKSSAYAPYQGNNDAGIQATGDATFPKLGPKGGNTPLSSAEHQSLGRLNRRVAIAAVTAGNCPSSGAVTKWACVLMLHPINQGGSPSPTMFLEYLGLTTDAGSPCATSGVPGGPTGTGASVPTLVR